MKCPNCGGEIGRFELAPECKHCGVNIFYSQQERLLAEDAKKCELEFASFRILATKLKSAFIGGPVQILRIVAMVMAIGFIFIPFATVEAVMPLFSSKISFGAFGAYQAFSGGELEVMLNLREYVPDAFAASAAMCALFVLIFLMGLGVFVLLVLSFVNMKKTAKASCAFAAVGFALCIGAAGLGIALPRIVEGSFISARPGAGAFACAAVFVFIFVLNLLVVKKNIMPVVSETDLERVAIRKKVKAGEIKLEDLPLPVLESEEEREKRLEKEAASRQLAEKARGGEHNG